MKGIQDLKGTSLELTNKTTVGFILANRFYIRFKLKILNNESQEKYVIAQKNVPNLHYENKLTKNIIPTYIK